MMAANTGTKLNSLRELMLSRRLHVYIIPHADEHQSEQLDHYAERLAWLTNFTGSAGSAIVMYDRAAVFVDGRYTIQAAKQVDQTLFEIVHLPDETPAQWLSKYLAPGDNLAIDSWLHTENEVLHLKSVCEQTGAVFITVPDSLIDKIWSDQPKPSSHKAYIHELEYAGVPHQKKIKHIAVDLKAKGVEYAVVSSLASICWLLNIRGRDVDDTPVVFAFAIIGADESVQLFMDRKKISDEIMTHLDAFISLNDKLDIADFLSDLPDTAVVQIDPKSTPYRLVEALSGKVIARGLDPCVFPSACKNSVELQGVRAAHVRDGAALCNFFAWLDIHLKEGYMVSELDAVRTLLDFRREQKLFVSNSFDTISGSGSNGAIVHYRATPETDRLLNDDTIFLVDSGGQYYDGTTDVTRVVAVKEPTAEQKDRFTRVLKGHIALARALFPRGTFGCQLDVLARQSLWQAGLDYAHGTGHGVGSFLGVHDGPQGISKAVGRGVPLCEGMVLSNEPGYYKEGEYGFRIESLVIVQEVHIPHAEQPMLGFETITLAPIERKLIDLSMLDKAELDWLNAYHTEIHRKLSPLVKEETRTWLSEATARL